jgi:hypothetical protein
VIGGCRGGSWNSLSIASGEVKGLDDRMASMLFVVAKKAADSRLAGTRSIPPAERGNSWNMWLLSYRIGTGIQ